MLTLELELCDGPPTILNPGILPSCIDEGFSLRVYCTCMRCPTPTLDGALPVKVTPSANATNDANKMAIIDKNFLISVPI